MSPSTIDTELLEQAVEKLPADALMPQRKQALTQFAATGFPTTRHEDWKYTNLAPAIELSNLWLREAARGLPELAVSPSVREYAGNLAAGIDAHWLVIANGLYRGNLQDGALEEARGISLPGLEIASIASDDVARSMAASDAMTHFNTALLRDALHVRIDADHEPDKPLGLLVIDDASAGATVSQARVVIEAGPMSRAQIIEYHASVGRHEHFANVVTELDIAQNAKIDYLRIQDRDRSHFQIGRLRATLGRDATLHHSALDLGGALIRNDVIAEIAAPGAGVELYGLYLADGTQHIDNHTRVDHKVGPANSREEYRGILSDEARCVFNGKAIVHSDADGTDAHQANHNLLLSDKAEIDTKPELEIYADDVKCSHGATVGQLDKAALFYLRSRGLDHAEAARVLTRAFAAAIVARTRIGNARSHIENLIDRRLEELVGGSL